MTPLHVAVRMDSAVDASYAEVLTVLLDRGADTDAIDAYGRSPLGYANLETAQLLLDAGAYPDAGVNTPLIEAIRDGDIALAELLIENGADVNARRHDRTYLHIVVENGAGVDMARLLLDAGADLEALDQGGIRGRIHSSAVCGAVWRPRPGRTVPGPATPTFTLSDSVGTFFGLHLTAARR